MVDNFLLECDREGRILWLSEKLRARLGYPTNLLETFAEAEAERVRQYLRQCKVDDTLAAEIPVASRQMVPVKFSCVLSTSDRLVLSAELRQRAGDRLQGACADLTTLENRVLQHYFRLVRAQQALDGRLNGSRRNPALALIERLDRERARLGRELHSGAGQSLAAIKLQLELIEKTAPDLPGEIRAYLDRIGLLAQEAHAEVRAVSHRLHPPDWQALGLADALRNLWRHSGIPERFQGSLSIGPLSAEPPHPIRVALYRTAQEALSNAVRHAGATRIGLSLEERAGRLHLSVEDNGHGFDVPRTAAAGGIGLRSIRDQMRDLGGEFHLRSGPGGTKLEVVIPVESFGE